MWIVWAAGWVDDGNLSWVIHLSAASNPLVGNICIFRTPTNATRSHVYPDTCLTRISDKWMMVTILTIIHLTEAPNPIVLKKLNCLTHGWNLE